MKFSKKSQMSLFIIIGIVLVVIISLFVIIRMNIKRSDIKEVKQDVVSFQRLEKDADKYIESCIKDSALIGIETYGLNSPDILESYLEDEIMLCTDGFVIYENVAEISQEKPSVNININDDIVIFDIDYLVTFTNEEEKFQLQDFSYSFRTNTVIDVDNGIIAKNTFYQSEDGKVNLYFSEDTKVTKDGKSIDSISFNVEDDNIYGLQNGIVIGSVVYEALPHGAKFDPPIEVTVKLDESDIKGLDTSALKLAFYDASVDLWITYPSEFDKDNMVVTGLVDHFSLISVTICGSESEGTKTIPMNFVFKDPYLDTDGTDLGCNQKHWMYNSAMDDHGGFGFHLLPEFMSSLKCEYQDDDMITYNYGKEIPIEACHDLDSGYIQDWDGDDDPTYEINEANVFFGSVSIKTLKNGGKKYLHEVLHENYPVFNSTSGLTESQYNDFLDYVKENCVSAVSKHAIEKIDNEFDWFTEEHISGDGIRDGADIYCSVDLSGVEVLSKAEFVGKYENNKINVGYHNNENEDNLVEKKQICWADKCSDALTMEWYPELEYSTKSGDRGGFFATPKTFGFAFEQQNPFTGLNYDEIKKINDNRPNVFFSPLLGEGEYTFYLQPGGQSCVDSSNVGCCIHYYQDINSPDNCVNIIKEHCKAESNEQILFIKETYCGEIPQCGGRISGREDPSKARAYLILNDIKVDEDNILTYRHGFPFASQSGKPHYVTSLVNEEESLTNLEVANSQEYLPLVYDMETIEERSWSCSDVCMWTINEELGSIIDLSGEKDEEDLVTSASPGKLRSGYNTVKVRVANLNDACMYARGFLQLKGQGMSFAVREYEDEKELTRPKIDIDCDAIDGCWIKDLDYCVFKSDKYQGFCCFGPGEGYKKYDKTHLEFFDDRECYVDENTRPQDEITCNLQGGYWRNGFCVMSHEYNWGYCWYGSSDEDDLAKRELPYPHFEPVPEEGCPCPDGKKCLLADDCKNKVDKYNTHRCSEESGQYKYCCELGEGVPEPEIEGCCIIYSEGVEFECNPSVENECVESSNNFHEIVFEKKSCNDIPECENIIVELCGNGQIDNEEDCDDGNTEDNDGCSADCELEEGWTCDGEPSVCVEDTEGCCITSHNDELMNCKSGLRSECDDESDPHLDLDFNEESCEEIELCEGKIIEEQPQCGDGKINEGEGCDDENTKDNDGCSKTCEIEDGWTCENEPSECEEETVEGMKVFERAFPGTAVGNAEVLSAMINKCYEINGNTNKQDLKTCLGENAPHIIDNENLASGTWPYTFEGCGGSTDPLQCLCYVEAIKGIGFGDTRLTQAWDIVTYHEDDLTTYNNPSQLSVGNYVIFGNNAPGHIAYIVGKSNGELYYTDANQDDNGKVVYNQPLSEHPRLNEIKYFG